MVKPTNNETQLPNPTTPTNFRQRFFDYLKRVKDGETIILKGRRDEQASVILSYQKYQTLMQNTITLATDQKTVAERKLALLQALTPTHFYYQGRKQLMTLFEQILPGNDDEIFNPVQAIMATITCEWLYANGHELTFGAIKQSMTTEFAVFKQLVLNDAKRRQAKLPLYWVTVNDQFKTIAQMTSAEQTLHLMQQFLIEAL